jgi:hypothetical protein
MASNQRSTGRTRESSLLVKYTAVKMQSTQLPVQYTEACKALAACQRLDEAKSYADKADALAAWAKIYQSDKAAVEARRLKLHAYRRMNELAEQIRPKQGGVKGKKNGGTLPGPTSLLQEFGLTRAKANSVRKIGQLKPHRFEEIVNAARVLSPEQVRIREGSGSDTYIAWTLIGGPKFRAYCRKFDAKEIARGLRPDESQKALQTCVEIRQWLDRFESYLK